MANLNQITISTLISSHLFLGLLTYWLGLQASDFHALFTSESSDCEKWANPLGDLPFPDVHAPIYLIALTKYEAFIGQALLELATNYSHLLQTELLRKIETYLLLYQEERTRANLTNVSPHDHTILVAQNPLLTLNMVWRFTYDLTVIFEQLQAQTFISRVKNGPGKELSTNLNAFAKWPNEWTLNEAMTGFFRIQLVYDMDAKNLANRKLFGVDTGFRMSIALIIELGQYARLQNMYTLAVPWLELACQELKMLSTKNPNTEIFEKTLRQMRTYLLETMIEHDLHLPNKQAWEFYYYKDFLLDKNQKPVQDRLAIRKMNFTNTRRISGESYHNVRNYWSLCSGINHQTEHEKSELFCWYDTSTDSALTIFPIKKELLSRSPFVVQMYDVINEPTINELTKHTEVQLERSRVVEEKASDGNVAGHYTPMSDARTSVEAFVFDQGPLAQKLGKFMEIVTGLRVISPKSSENILVASYSFGGHYDCHLDSFADETTYGENGNRIATMMFYLDNTAAGGLTAFPQAGVAAKPIKGSAVFWYNIKRSGEIDDNTFHCACPVVLGHKTISTKWIRYAEQFRTHPCGLKPDDLYVPIPKF